jgi:hypothetical protein
LWLVWFWIFFPPKKPKTDGSFELEIFKITIIENYFKNSKSHPTLRSTLHTKSHGQLNRGFLFCAIIEISLKGFALGLKGWKRKYVFLS